LLEALERCQAALAQVELTTGCEAPDQIGYEHLAGDGERADPHRVITHAPNRRPSSGSGSPACRLTRTRKLQP
jgi:hypothetical protein